MLQEFELPFDTEISALDDDPTLFDPEPDWFGDLALATNEHHEHDGLGLRSVVDEPEALSKAWKRTTREEHFSSGAQRFKIRKRKRSRAA